MAKNNVSCGVTVGPSVTKATPIGFIEGLQLLLIAFRLSIHPEWSIWFTLAPSILIVSIAAIAGVLSTVISTSKS